MLHFDFINWKSLCICSGRLNGRDSMLGGILPATGLSQVRNAFSMDVTLSVEFQHLRGWQKLGFSQWLSDP
jgi:hypothetical protein